VTDAFEAIDFFVDESLFDDPYPYFEYLRETRGPVWIDDRYNMAVVTGHDEEVAVLRDNETFSSCNSPAGPFAALPVEVEGDDAGPVIDQYRDQMPMHEYMVTMDRPQHDDYRGLMKRLFTPKRLAENEDFMWRLADEQMKPFIEVGEVEFSNAYSSPFAGLVIADLLGVPDEDMPRFREYFDAQLQDVGDNTTAMVENPLAFFHDSFAGYIEERRRQPRADVLTHLAEAKFADGSQPDVDTLARESAFVFAAGQETTVRLLTFSLRHLAENPDVQERLRRERELIPTFVEEMLRLESPIKAHFRLARRTTTVGGVRIAAGMTVMLVNGAANRDPRHFEDPTAAKLDRDNARDQLAFSRGIHVCLGQSLARAEGRVTLERVLDRMADIRISEAAHGPADARRWEYLPTWLFRGLTALYLEFTPTGV
jgi:cytochrome P450 family 150 subfamily A5